MSDSLQPPGLQHARLPCPSLSPRVCSNSCSLSHWCHPAILSSVIPSFSHPQSFPASGSFPMSQLFTSGGQNTGGLASALVLPMNFQGWFPLDWLVWSCCSPRDCISVQFSSGQLLSRAQPFATPWIAARQASPSITNSQSLPKLMPIKSMMPSSHLILSPSSSPAPNPSQHQGRFQWVNSLHEVTKVLEFQLQHQSFQWTPRTDLLQDGLVGSPCNQRSKGLSRVFSNTIVQSHQFFSAQLSSQSNSHIHTWPLEKP